MQVYPRVCGGTARRGITIGFLRGLSPRVRGNRKYGSRRHLYMGSIPACAGEPLPRLYGPKSTLGLSPRVRGNHAQAAQSGDGERSIPACAGEPPALRNRPPKSGVYPRVCGGTSSRDTPATKVEGLSPRVRGNRYVHHVPCTQKGSIPACAGEPMKSSRGSGMARVYPRVCGGTHRKQC